MSRIMTPAPTRGAAPSHSPPDTRYTPGGSLAGALGWFSIGLGLAEILAPKRLADTIGFRNDPSWLPLCGAREIISGLGILSEDRPAFWLWTRVLGDAMDLALLADAWRKADDEGRQRLAKAVAAVAGVTVLDVVNSLQLSAAVALTDEGD